MHVVTRAPFLPASRRQLTTTITTSLYDVLEAILEEVPAGSGGDKLATEVVAHLLDSGRIHVIGDSRCFTGSQLCC